jgi:DNA-binding transcriptional regulator LsrR (DeoR family)
MRDGTIMTQEELDILLANGAVGDICLRFFNGIGNSIQSEINERVIGITLDEIKKIDRVVGVAGGPQKEKVIHAALMGKLINILVTDHITAQKLIGN